jgi:hypothetical protein
MAPKKAAKAPKFTYDYSGLKEGMRVQAESDGSFLAAEIVAVSESKNRANKPVKISWKGYDKVYDEWVGGDRLKSKALKKTRVEPENKRPPLEFNFGYWKIRGLGSIFRMIFEYRGVKYTDNQYSTAEEWFKTDKPKILEKNPLANLPYVQCNNDTICQTNACLDYIGDKLRLSGGGYQQRLLNSQLLNEIYDVRNDIIAISYKFKEVVRTEAELKEKLEKHWEGSGSFKKFEAILEKGGTDFFCGKVPLTSDFHIWEMLDQNRMLAERNGKTNFFDGIPKCKAFYDRFKELPTLKKYFESDDYKLDVNNKALVETWFA